MGQLVEFPLEDGGSVLVEVDAAVGPVTRGLGDRHEVAEQAQQTFEQAVARVQPAAQALISRLRSLADAPEEIGVEFGLELSAEAGAFIAAASSTANFKVTLTWRRDLLAHGRRSPREHVVARRVDLPETSTSSIERGDEDVYRARVVNAPAGQTPPTTFTVPSTSLELENFVLRVGRPRRVVRRVDAPETAAIKSFGGQLYRALFHDQLEVNLLRSLSEAAAQRAGLRIRLRLADTPELAELPWEFLYDQTRNRFLGLSDRTPTDPLPGGPRTHPVPSRSAHHFRCWS